MLCDFSMLVSTEMGARQSTRCVVTTRGRRSGSVPPGPGDYGVRRARVGTVSSVSTVVAFSLDWLLSRSRRRTDRHGHLTHPFARCCMPTNCTSKLDKKVI